MDSLVDAISDMQEDSVTVHLIIAMLHGDGHEIKLKFNLSWI